MYEWKSEQQIEFKASITDAFKALRKEGYWARQNWQCCQSCGWAAIPGQKDDKAVFYHRQDAEDLRSRPPSVMLAWAGDGSKITEILKQYVDVEWDGLDSTRINCKPKEYNS